MAQKLFYTFHFAIVLLVSSIVISDVSGIYPGMLFEYTKENGFFELASGLLLFLSGTALLLIAKTFTQRNIKYLSLFTGLILILGAMEELSWGQHIFGFETGELFKNNKQHETNLHNFIPGWIFGLSINLSFYVFFVFIPIFSYLFENRIFSGKYSKLDQLRAFVPSLNLALVFCFGFSLQKYFIIETYTDTLALVFSLLLLAIAANKKKDFWFTVHITLIILATILFMFSQELFRFKNLQYEIREFVFIYGMIYWLSLCINTIHKQQSR